MKRRKDPGPQPNLGFLRDPPKGAKRAAMPDFIQPCHPTLKDKLPTGSGWIHEIKLDGYRTQAHLRGGLPVIYTRRGYDWTDRFKSIAVALSGLSATNVVLDGEVVVLAQSGSSDFSALQSQLAAKRSDKLTYYAFDLLFLDGWDLRKVSLIQRKSVLRDLLATTRDPIIFGDHLIGSAQKIYRQACRMELEGVVSKKEQSVYSSGRSLNWIKATCRLRETFLVAGVAFKSGKLDGIYLARREEDELLYAGKVDRGFTDRTEQEMRKLAEQLSVRRPPLTQRISKPKAKWMKPRVQVDIEFRGITTDGKLRHPSFKGLR